MSAPKFTPGPWGCSGAHVWSWSAKDRGNVAECESFEGSGSPLQSDAEKDAERIANAHLIAASPKLYAALEAAVAQLKVAMKRAEDDDSPHARVYEEVRELGLAALAEARGAA